MQLGSSFLLLLWCLILFFCFFYWRCIRPTTLDLRKQAACLSRVRTAVLREICILSKQDVSVCLNDRMAKAQIKETVHPKLKIKSQNKTFLELHRKTELQHSAEQLKQLRLDLNIRSLHQLVCWERKVSAHKSSTAHHLKDKVFFLSDDCVEPFH